MRHRFRIALVLCWSTLACARSAEAPDAEPAPPARAALRRDAVGCWVLRDRYGRAAEGHIYWAPTYVALLRDDAAAPASPDRRAVRYGANWIPLPLELEPGIRGAITWRADSLTDTIRIAFNNAFSGSVFVLALSEQGPPAKTLYGRAFEFYDAGPPWEKAMGSASATRVPCAVQPPPGV